MRLRVQHVVTERRLFAGRHVSRGRAQVGPAENPERNKNAARHEDRRIVERSRLQSKAFKALDQNPLCECFLNAF